MRNFKTLLGILTAVLVSANVSAETLTEDFESVTITDVDNWGYGSGLSNGWKIVGGSIYSSAGSTNYGLWNKGNDGSSQSLEASYSSSNSAFVVIPLELSGTFKFYARKTSTSSSTKGYVDLYDVEPDGDTYKKSSTSSFMSWTLTSTTWTEYSVDLGEEPRMIAIVLARAAVDDVTFDTYEASEGARLAVSLAGNTVKNGSDYGFGLVEGSAAVDYILKNSGTSTLTATVSCTGDYTASVENVTLEADEEITVTVEQNDVPGAKSGMLTISPDGLEAFSVNLAGIVRDPSKLYVDFEKMPAGWTIDTENWTIADGYAKIGYYSSYNGNGRIESPAVEIAADEQFYLRYSKNTSSSYSSAYLNIWTSEDGTNWTKFGGQIGTDAVYGEWKETVITGFPISARYVAISGQYMAIDDLYGFSMPTKPIMTITTDAVVTKNETGTEITDNFGYMKCTGSHTYTVSNMGAGVLKINIASSAPEFTVSETSLEVAAGESADFDLTFNYDDNYGVKTADITLEPTDGNLPAVTIKARAVAQDPDTFEADFENGIPTNWTNNGWETVSAPSYGNGTMMAYAGRYNTSSTLTTPRLVAQEGDVIEMEALLPWNDETLTMEYSLDEGETWTVAFAETPAENNTLTKLFFTAPVDGFYYLRFSGRYNYIDNVIGFKYAPTEVAASDMNFTQQWATLCYPADVVLAEDVQAFSVMNVADDVIELAEIENVVPAFEPVVMYNGGDSVQQLPATSFVNRNSEPIPGTTGNLLYGCTGVNQLNKNTQYVMQEQNGKVAFFRVSSSNPITTTPFRCYIELPSYSSAKQISFPNMDNTATAISGMTAGNKADAVYDLAGNRVTKLVKGGIYVVGDKKIIVK